LATNCAPPGVLLSAVDAIIGKPFQMEELREAIANLLAETDSLLNAQSGRDGVQT